MNIGNKRSSIAWMVMIFIILIVNCTSNDTNTSTDRKDYQDFEVSFTEVLAIREDQNNPESYFGSLDMVKLDSLNNIYILDDRNNAVLKFDKNGNFLKKIGKKGRGPGELERPIFMLVDHELVLISEGTKRIDVFDLEGNYKSSHSNKDLYIYTNLIRSNDNGFWSLTIPIASNVDSVRILTELDSELNQIGEAQISPKLFYENYDRDKANITTGAVTSIVRIDSITFAMVFQDLYNGKILEFENRDDQWNLNKEIKGKNIQKLYTLEQKKDVAEFNINVFNKKYKYDLHSKSKGLFQLNNKNFVHFLELDVGDSLEYGVELFDSSWNYLGYYFSPQ